MIQIHQCNSETPEPGTTALVKTKDGNLLVGRMGTDGFWHNTTDDEGDDRILNPVRWCPIDAKGEQTMSDQVNHPKHYTSHPSGVECITVTEHMGFNIGNAIKYLWRADEKGNAIEDLRKAEWYVRREIERRTRE